jgi:hypothetical protein
MIGLTFCCQYLFTGGGHDRIIRVKDEGDLVPPKVDGGSDGF